MVIERFNGEYSFLSNFYESQITYDDITYRNNESAFQAQKDLSRREEFVNLTGYESRKLGRKVNLRKDWDECKFKIMEDIVRLKFSQNEELKSKLLKTGDAILIEGNNWRDVYWGVYKGKSENNLGKILMKVRDELKNETI